MHKFIAFVTIALILVHASEAGVFGRSYGGGGGSGSSSGQRSAGYVGRRNSYMLGHGATTSENGIPVSDSIAQSPRASAKTSNLSAWGLILIIMTVIVLAFAFYYGIICYPLLCRHEKSWNVLDVSSTTSGASSRSTEFESHPFHTRSTSPSESH